MKLSQTQWEKTAVFLSTTRPLEQILFNYHFRTGSLEDVLDALAVFQNEDGGFGHGLEPDLQSPNSSVLATTVAFQILRDLGIEADLILFHPYDRWGFSDMDAKTDDRYLRCIVARLAAYRNVWWSFANEYDLMEQKRMSDWDNFFRLVQECDPYQHLRSIHNCRAFYDHAKPWVTHQSVQRHNLEQTGRCRALPEACCCG